MSRRDTVTKVSPVEFLRSFRRECITPEKAALLEKYLVEQGAMTPTTSTTDDGKEK